MSQVRCVVLATGSGRGFAEDVLSRGSCTPAVTSRASGQERITVPLLELAKTTSLDTWLAALRACTHLLPLHERVHLLCTQENEQEISEWAAQAGFPQECILPLAGAGADPPRHLEQVAAYIEEQAVTQHLVVIDAEAVTEPGFDLQRVVQTALVRSKDTVCLAPSVARTSVSGRLVAEVADGSSNPRIASFAPADSEACTSSEAANGLMVAPMYVFRRTSLPLVAELACMLADGPCSMAQLLPELAARVPVYGIEIECCFRITDVEDFLLVDSFFQYYQREQRKAAAQAKGRGTHVYVELMAQATAKRAESLARQTGLPDVTEGSIAARLRLPVRPVLDQFLQVYQRTLNLDTTPKVPERFTDVSTWRLKPRQEHPVYTTSNNTYGYKRPSQHEMPMNWSGIQGEFTKHFVYNNRNQSLCTAVTRSKVHKALDEL